MGIEGRRRGQATVSPSRCGAATGERKEVGDRGKEQAGPRGGYGIGQLGRRPGSPLLCLSFQADPHGVCASPWMRWCDGSLARIPGDVTAHKRGSPLPPPSSTSPAAQLHSTSSSIR